MMTAQQLLQSLQILVEVLGPEIEVFQRDSDRYVSASLYVYPGRLTDAQKARLAEGGWYLFGSTLDLTL
jgi:hypothetical protein